MAGVGMTRREELEELIEHCVAVLDVIDGDPEAEDNGDCELEPDREPDHDAEIDHEDEARFQPAMMA